MDWDDFKKSYHIDHINPCDNYDLTNIEEQKKCFSWKNLQIISKEENLKKSNKILLESIKKHELLVEEFLKNN
jgi:hypothetical protein